MEQLLETAMPLLLEILGVALASVLIWAATKFTQRTGIVIEQTHRDALHSALMTGARLAAARQLTGSAAIALVIEYVRKSVPDAIGKLAPPESVLRELAESKVQEVVQDKLSDLLAGAGLSVPQAR